MIKDATDTLNSRRRALFRLAVLLPIILISIAVTAQKTQGRKGTFIVPNRKCAVDFLISDIEAKSLKHNAEDEEVEKIKNLIIIANAELIKNVVNQYGVKTCLGADATTESITNQTATKTSDGLKITMEGKGEKTFTCEAMLDLSKPTKLKFLDLKVKETAQTAEATETGSKNNETTTSKSETKVEQKKEEPTNPSKETSNANKLPTTPNVKQFPVNLEKTMRAIAIPTARIKS